MSNSRATHKHQSGGAPATDHGGWTAPPWPIATEPAHSPAWCWNMPSYLDMPEMFGVLREPDASP